MVRIRGFHCRGPGSIPDRGTEVPHAMQCSWKKKKEREREKEKRMKRSEESLWSLGILLREIIYALLES